MIANNMMGKAMLYFRSKF